MTVHQNDGVRGSRHGQAEDLAGMDEQRVLRADGNKLVAFDAAARVQEQHGQTFTFRVEMRMGGDVQFPILGGLVGRVALLQRFRRGTFAQGRHLVFVGAGRKLERLDKRGKKRCRVHNHFRR